MRIVALFLFFCITLMGGGFWLSHIDTTCKIPIYYRIGEIDARFGTTEEELVKIAQKSELLWETPVGKELFIYDKDAALPINLVFDERQENAEREQELKEDLEAKEGMSESVAKRYEVLVAEFRKQKKEYEARVIAYETKLSAYNDEVTEWNDKGGAPQNEITKLESTKTKLVTEEKTLEALLTKLNATIDDLNDIGAKGNSLVADYNDVVNTYNDQVAEMHEFTQGDYTRDAIHIYTYNSEDELTIVLAHEFGHALSLDHIENEESIMFHNMGAQDIESGITGEDRAEFDRMCTDQGTFSRAKNVLMKAFEGFAL